MRAYPVYDGINILDDARVAGTPRVIEIHDQDGTPYYLKAYPVYGGIDVAPNPHGIKSWGDSMIWGDPVTIGFDQSVMRYLAKAYPSATGLSAETPDSANTLIGIQPDQQIYGDVYVAGITSGVNRYYFKVYARTVALEVMPVRICNRCLAVWVEDDQMYEEVDRCPHCGVRARSPVWAGKDDPAVGGWM